MITYSHVALIVSLGHESGQGVTQHLGLSPTKIRESTMQRRDDAGVMRPVGGALWMLNSPMDASHQPLERIHSLLDLVEPIGDRIATLDVKYSRWIDMVFHVRLRSEQGIDFDWLSLPHQTMHRISTLRLNLSYEVFRFNHSQVRPWYKRFFAKQA